MVVVGARVAGSPAATELARRGRRVIVLDAATFPSDTLSTHVIFPTCVAELNALGALEPLLASGSPTHPHVLINHGGVDVNWDYTAVDGFNYGMCPRRTTLDNILVQTARNAGADVREATKVTGLEWSSGRVSAVHWQDRKGKTGTIATKLLIGADGRRSTVAEMVGAKEPYRRDENGRGLVFMYVDDPYPADSIERKHLYQWRVGQTLGMYFPTCDNGGLILFMPPREEVALYGQDLVYWNEQMEKYPLLKARIAGGAPRTKLRKASDPFSYFRRSSGRGWALVGDAGHFKDPVIAQGVRDGIYYGRRLGMVAAASLDDPAWLDRRLYEWELQRDRDCIVSYHFALRLSRTHPVSPVELEMWKALEPNYDLSRELGDTFSRKQSAEKLLSYPHLIGWTLKALADSSYPKSLVMKDVTDELATKARLYRDLARIKTGKRVKGRNWDAWGGDAKPAAEGTTEKPATAYVPAKEPQRSDLLAEEDEIKNKEKVAI
ncbi:MAG: NAD(P)/FAD-dependent oxidoreductase [Acidimicrobiia bacterium]